MTTVLKNLWNNKAVRQALIGLAIALLTFAGTYFGLMPGPVVVPVPIGAVAENHVGPQGWIDDPDAVAAVVGSLPIKSFAGTEAGGVAEDSLPDHVYSWTLWPKVTGGPIPNKDQGSVGDCTGFGSATAIETTLVGAISHGSPYKFTRICEEALYAGARIQIGHNQIRGDGATGAWVAKYVNQWGVTPRLTVAGIDLTLYSEARARDWGRSGSPAGVLLAAKDHPVKDITQVLNWTEAKKALASSYGVGVCSNQGFTMTRDSRGVCQPKGQWAHCMALIGYQAEGGKEFGFIMNSWGPTAFTGPTGWGDAPVGGFWADSAVIDRMLKQGDSWTFSDVKGFPRKVIDWPVRTTPKQKALVGPLLALAL